MDGDGLAARVMQGVMRARSSRLGGDSDGGDADAVGAGDMKPNKSDEGSGVPSFSHPSIDEEVVMSGSRCGERAAKISGPRYTPALVSSLA